MLDFSKELSDLYTELEEVKAMSDEDFTAKYKDNDSKEEYIEILLDEINYLEPGEDEVEEEHDEWDDHGFRDSVDYYNFVL